MLTISQLHKSYKRHHVLDNISLHFNKGRSIGLIGANGEGKTTFFKCLLNACKIDSGSIMINGHSHAEAEARKHLAFLPEHFQAPYYLTGLEFLKLMLKMQQVSYDKEHIEKLLTVLLFDLNALSRPARTYSKGMMQKLGLTACLASEKPLMVLDEPMSGLDPAARHGLKKLLTEQKEGGKTILFSTHLLHDIESLCDDIVILSGSQIRFSGALQEALITFKANSLEEAYLNCLKSISPATT